MKPCWKDCGLTAKGAKAAEQAAPHLEAAVRILEGDTDVIQRVLKEVIFRVHDLPNRTRKYQNAYFRNNGYRSESGGETS